MPQVPDLRSFDASPCLCDECTSDALFVRAVRAPREATTRTPWAVFCRACGGLVHLTAHEYSWQLSRSDDGWQCPRCGDVAAWSEDEFDAYSEILDDAAR